MCSYHSDVMISHSQLFLILTLSTMRFKLTRLPYVSPDGVSSFTVGQFVRFDVPEGYQFVRKYPLLPGNDLLPIKGYLLKAIVDLPRNDEVQEAEMS